MLVKFESSKSFGGLQTFDCGLEPVNEFLKKGLKEHHKKNYNQTYFFLNPNNEVVAYYTLQAFSLTREFLSDVIKTSIPREIPVFRISLLGVQLNMQKQGIGTALIGHAVQTTKEIQKIIGTTGLFLDSDPKAINLYLKSGFINITPIQNDSETPMIYQFWIFIIPLPTPPIKKPTWFLK